MTESLDTIYDTIKLKVNADGSASATFRTEIDIYTVNISNAGKINLNFAGVFIPVVASSITFSSKLLFMGHADASHAEFTTYVYPTVVKCIEMFVTAREKMKKPVYGFTCSVAGDNARGSKRKIYSALFSFSTRFGYHKWKNELIAIKLDTYEKLKKNGFKTDNGHVLFDPEL